MSTRQANRYPALGLTPSRQGLSSLLTIYAALAPEAGLRSTFGESVSGPVADIVVRNWGETTSVQSVIASDANAGGG